MKYEEMINSPPWNPGYQRFHLSNGTIIKGSEDTYLKWKQMNMPEDFKGKSVLDLCCNTGFFCFESRKRNAGLVVGVDRSNKWLEFARELAIYEFKQYVPFLCMDIRDLQASTLGQFDFTYLLGSMHYFTDIQGLMKKISALTKEYLVLEAYISRIEDEKLMEVDRRNLLIPTMPYLMLVLEQNFKKIENLGPCVTPDGSYRILLKCYNNE